MDPFEQFFGQIQNIQGKEYIIEFGQDIGKKKMRFETMLLLPSGFDLDRPFMFRLTSNDKELKTAHGYSDLDKVLKK